jgi:hypothetical protein
MEIVMQWLLRLYWRIQNWCFVRTTVKLPLKVIKGDYPINTRYIQEESRLSKVIVVEAQPANRMVFVLHGEPICLYFPYTYFVIRYTESVSPYHGKRYIASSMYIGFSVNRLESANGMVGKLPLSNYSSNFSFCLGDAGAKLGAYKTVRELVEAHMNVFWQTAFEMSKQGCEDWISATKASVGGPCVKRFIARREQTFIYKLMGADANKHVSKNEQFFDYQSEPAEPEPEPEPEPKERPSGDRPNRRKRRKGAYRKA